MNEYMKPPFPEPSEKNGQGGRERSGKEGAVKGELFEMHSSSQASILSADMGSGLFDVKPAGFANCLEKCRGRTIGDKPSDRAVRESSSGGLGFG
jgi:hypothetical protein